MEGINIGSLYLSLGLDPSSYHQNLQAARQEAMKVGAEIEKNLNLGLKPKVDHTELYALNKHLDLKQKHAQELNRYFQQNPLKPRVDTSEIDLATQKLNEFKRSISDIKSQAGTRIQVQAEHRINTSDLDRSLRSATKQLEKVGKDIGDEISKRISKAEIKVKSSSSGGGLLGGIFQGVTHQVGVRLASGLETSFKQKTGQSFSGIGRSVGGYAIDRGTNIAQSVAKAAGYASGLDEVEKEIKAVGKAIDGFLDPKKFAVKIRGFEDRLVSVLEDVFVFKRPDRAVSKIKQDLQQPIEFAQEAGLRVAGAGVRMGAQPLRIRKRVLLARSAEEARGIAGGIAVDDNDEIRNAKSIALITGGIDYQRGQGNTPFAHNIVRRVLPDAYSVPVHNDWSNDKDSLGNLFEIRKHLASLVGIKNGSAMPVDRLLQVAIEKGFNPDSIKMASHAMAYREKYPNKPINLLGTSGGSYVVEEAIAILERAGIKGIKGAGITAPLAGLTPTASAKNFQANVGDLDPLYLAMFGGRHVSADKESTAYKRSMEAMPIKLPGLIAPSNRNKVVPGAGVGHALLPFVAEQGFQENLAKFLGESIAPISHDFTGQKGIANLDFLRVQQDERQTLPRTLKAVFGDRSTISQIRRNGSEGAEGYSFFDPDHPDWRRDNDLKAMTATVGKKGKRASGAIKEEFDQYMAFLDAMQKGLGGLYEGGKIKPEMIEALHKGAKLYPELEPLKRQVHAQLTEHSRLRSLDTDADLWAEPRSPREKYKDQQRLQRLDRRFDNPNALLAKMSNLKVADDREAERVRQAAAGAARKAEEQSTAASLQVVKSEVADQVEGLAGKAAKASTSVIRKVMAGAGAMTNAGAISLMNRKLGTIDAFQDQGVAPKIASFKDLSMRGYMEIAKQDMGSVLKALQGSVGKGYAIAKGVENFALDALPFGHTAKGVVQNVALPAVAFNAATHMLPGGAAMGHAATDAVSHALQLPMGAVGEATTMAVNNALTGAIEQIPMIGHKLAPALAQGISGLISGAVETASSTIAGAATPVLGGQAMLSPVKAIGNAVIGNQDPLIAETQRKLKVLNAGVNQARNLLSPRPEQAGLYIDGIQQDIKVIGAQVDQAIAALPPENRMSEGAQIANLKSQVAKTENKLNTLIQALKQVATNPGQVIDQSVHGEVIDAEVVPERLALKSAAVPQLRPGVTPQRSIKELGSSFTAQIQSAKGLNNPGIAAEVLASATEARNAIDALVKATGGNATKEFNKIVSTARGQITKAEKSAKQIVAEAQSAGVNVSVGFNQGLTSSIDQVKGAANHLAEAGIEEIKDVWDIHSPSRVGIWLGRMFGLGVQEGVESVSTGSVFQNFASESANALKGIIQNVKNAVNGVPALKNAIGIAIGAFAGFQALQFAAPILGQLKEMSQALINAALDSEALARSFALIGGGAEKGTAKMNEIAESSDQMGVNAKKAQEGYIQLAASTRETPLEGYATDQIASGLTKASSAYNLNPERQDLVNTAISQMAGKGVVSMEELRGQLSESLPGAMQIAARAMDMTTAEFTKFVESGNLASEDFLPRFAQQLKAELAVTAESSSKSAQSSFNRLDNALNRLQVTMGKLSLPVEVFRADILTKGLNLLEANMGTVMRTSTALAIVLLGIDKAFVSGSKSALRFAMSMNFAEAAGGLQKLSQGIQGVIGSFSGLIGRVAAVATVIAVASAAFELLKDRGGEFRDVADSNRKSLEEMQKTLGIPIDKKSDGLFGFFEYLKDSIPVIGSIAGMFEKLQSSLSGIKVPEPVKQLFQAVGQPFGLGQGGIIDAYKKTMADKEKYDQNKAVAEVRQTSQRGASIAASFTQNTGLVQRNKDLEAQIDDVQLRQRVLRQNNPNDSMGLTALRQEEAEIRKRGSSTLNQVAAIRSQLNKNVEDIRATISALEKKPGNESQIAQLKQDLQAAEQAQADFSRATQPAIANLERMARLWKQVADQIEDAVAAGKQTQNMANVQVSEAQLTGVITPGQASGQKSLIEQSRMMSEMTQKYAALNALKARVNPDSAKVLAAYGLTNAGAAELSTQAESSQNPKEKQIFQQAAQLKQLESQVTQLQDDLTNSAAQMSQQLQDAAKTVQDFYRGIQRQSEDVALTVKSSNLEASLVNVKNRVKRSMDGFYDTFVDQFANGLIEVFSKWNESLKIGIDAQKQILQTTNQLTDQGLQAVELYKNLPGVGNVGANAPDGLVSDVTGAPGTVVMQRTGQIDENGLENLVVRVFDKQGKAISDSIVNSGVRSTQNMFGAGGTTRAGSLAPVEYGTYRIGSTQDARDVPGMGSNFIGVEPTFRTERAGIGFHNDGNRATSPGSAGCIVFKSEADFQAFQQALKRSGASEFIFKDGKALTQKIEAQSQSQGAPSNLNTFGFDQSRVKAGIDFYLSQGFGKRAAAYVIGNFMQESSLNPGADNGSHRGLAQWDASRSQGMPSDYQGQLRFSIQDMQRDTPSALAVFRNPNATDAQIMREISKWERYGSGEEASRFRYGKGLADQLGQGGGAVMSPTTGMTNQEIQNRETYATASADFKNTIDASLQIASQSAQQSADAVQRLAAANQGLAGTEAGQLLKRSIMQYRTSAEDQTYELTQKQRKQEDYNAELGFQTPEKLRANQERQVGRDYDDEMRDLTRKSKMIDEMIQKNNTLLSTLKELEKQGQFRGHEAELKGVYDSIGKTNSELQKSKAISDQLKKTIPETAQKRYNDIAMKDAVREEKDRLDARAEAQSKRQQIAQMQAAKYKRDSLENNPDFDVLKAAGIERDEQLRTIELDQAKELNSLREKFDLHKLTNVELEDQIRLTQQIADLSREEARAAYKSLEIQEQKRKSEEAIANRTQLFDSYKALGQEQGQSYKVFGLDTQASDFEREAAFAQQRFDFATQAHNIDQMAEKSKEFKAIAPELHQNLERLNRIKLDNLRAQFDPLTQVLTSTKDSFQNFFGSILSGSKGLGEAFRDLISSIGQNLASMASKMLTDQLFGALMGKKSFKDSKAESQATLGSISPLESYGGFNGQAGQLLATSVNDSATAFLGMSQQAGEAIVAAAQQFAQIVNSGSEIGTDGALPTSAFGREGFGNEMGDLSSLDRYANFGKDISSDLFDGVENATFSIQNGVKLASSMLAQSGAASSDNLLGGLSRGLPSILNELVGTFGGGGGFGGILSTVLGIGGKLLGGGLFGGGTGSSGIPIGDVVSVFGFADGGTVGANGLGMPDISKALKREALLSGRKPKLATLYEGEEVLTHHQARRYHELGLDKLVGNGIQSFARGGSVGSPPTFNASSFRSSSVSIDIPITVNADQGSGIDVNSLKRELKQELELKTREIIIKEQKPRGLLS